MELDCSTARTSWAGRGLGSGTFAMPLALHLANPGPLRLQEMAGVGCALGWAPMPRLSPVSPAVGCSSLSSFPCCRAQFREQEPTKEEAGAPMTTTRRRPGSAPLFWGAKGFVPPFPLPFPVLPLQCRRDWLCSAKHGGTKSEEGNPTHTTALGGARKRVADLEVTSC